MTRPAAFLLLLLCACTLAGAAEGGLLPGRVLRVIDGDTVDVRLSTGRIRVRLQGVDAPEGNQAGGKASTAYLASLVNDREVLLEPVTQDRYDRLVAVIHVGRVNVNREMVREGHAWAYRQYLRREDRGLCQDEFEARRSGRGLWRPSLAPARAPWEHRSSKARGPFTDFSRDRPRVCLEAIGRRPGR